MGQKFAQRINTPGRYDAQIVAAVNRGEPNLRIAREQFGLKTSHYTDDVLGGLDFVVVASTTVAHTEQVIAAARAGCHIFCEKPIALTLDEADRMIAAIREAGVISVVNYITRFNPAYLRISELVRSGELGRVLSVTHGRMRGYGLYGAGARHRAIEEPNESGGWTVHHACHDTDLLYWLGGPVREVYACTAGTAPEGLSEEIVSGIVRFSAGGHGVVEDSVCGIRDHYTRVIGEKGSIVLHGENESTFFRLRREGAEEDEMIPLEDRKRPGGGLDHFFECIARNEHSDMDLAGARPSLEIALALQESARRGEAVRL
jgi:predicted dehydrogenase